MTKMKAELVAGKGVHKIDSQKKIMMFKQNKTLSPKDTHRFPSSKLDSKILKLKKMLSSRSVPDQYRALKVLGNAMKQSNAISVSKRHSTMSHLMRADIISFIYAGFNTDNPDLAKPRFECVRQLIASTSLMQHNNALATLDFLLRWINHADSVTGKGLGLALTMLTRLVERLAVPAHELRRLVGVSAVGRTLDAIAAVAQKPQGQGGWQVQLCAGTALAALLSPHALGFAPDAVQVRVVSEVYGACLTQLSAALRAKAASGAVTDDTISHRAVATMAQMGNAAVSWHTAMVKSTAKESGSKPTNEPEGILLYRETVLAAVLENFVLVCTPFVSKVMIDEDKLPMYESFLRCSVSLLRCPALASNHSMLAFKLATSGHLQVLALLSGFQADKPTRLHKLVNSALGELLSTLAAEAFETDTLRERICEGALHLPPCPALWFNYLARPHSSDAFIHAVLAFAYFHCLLDNGAETCSPSLFPALVALLNLRFSPDRCVGVGPLLTKLIWFTFAVSHPRKGANLPDAARATEALVALLERVPLATAFTPHPALLRCACWVRLPTDLRTQILLQWLLVESDTDDDEFETLELASVLSNPLAAGMMLDVITMASADHAVKRGLDAMALAVLRWPRGVLVRTLACNLPRLLDKLLSLRCALSAGDCATLIALATGPLSERRDETLALNVAKSLSALVARATYAIEVPPTLYAATLWLALATVPHCPSALAALATRSEMSDSVERAAYSANPSLREVAYRLLAHVAAADDQAVLQWRVSVSGEHVLSALGSSIPALVLASLQLLYVLLPAQPRNDCVVTLDRPPRFLRHLTARTSTVSFKFQKCDRKVCDGAWQLLGRVAEVALREGSGQAEDVASAPWLELAVKHCRLSRHVLLFIKQWSQLFCLRTTPCASQQKFNLRWETLVAAVDRLLNERFGNKLREVAAATMKEVLIGQPGLDSSRASQLRKRIEELCRTSTEFT